LFAVHEGVNLSSIEIFPEVEVLVKTVPLQTCYFNHVNNLIRGAKNSIWICQYVFSTNVARRWQRSNKILKALISSAGRGVELRVLFDRPRLNSPNIRSNIRTVETLRDANIIVRCLAVNKCLHIKMVVFDKRVFLAGSHNLTDSSLYSPFELSFECRDDYLVNAAVIYFECLWNGNLSQPYSEALEEMAYGNRQKIF